MVYLATSQDYLKQSSLLLEAYPDTTRITTRYSYPKRPSAKERSKAKSKPATSGSAEPTEASAAPATLTLKTFNPTTGICLKYQTKKAAEVGRLIAGLGKLASGAPIEDFVPTQIPGKSPAGETEDVDMLDVPLRTMAPSPVNDEKDGASRSNTPGAGGASGGGGGGKSAKGKKKGKGKK
ncbi:hypothetical protein FQN49_002654 [Arthroderma sp. PD_2]|nr:hypothetical protein FQN49_002654 [Arthroderma sp. PD_2]